MNKLGVFGRVFFFGGWLTRILFEFSEESTVLP